MRWYVLSTFGRVVEIDVSPVLSVPYEIETIYDFVVTVKQSNIPGAGLGGTYCLFEEIGLKL